MSNVLVEQFAFVQGLAPQDINGAALTEDVISLKGAEQVDVFINVGAIGGTVSVTLKQSTDVAGTGEKALGFGFMWKSAATSVALTKTAVTSNTFDLGSSDDNKTVHIPVHASTLDVDNSFDCLRVDLTDPSAATVIAVTYIITGLRYQGATLVDPLTD